MRSLHVFSIAGAFAIALPVLAQAQKPGVYLPGQSRTTQTCSPMQVMQRLCLPANTRQTTVYPQQGYPVYPQQYPVYPQQYPVYPQQYPVYPSYPQTSSREVILPDGQRCMEHIDGTGRAHYKCPNVRNERARRNDERENIDWQLQAERRAAVQTRAAERDRAAQQSRAERETHGRPGVHERY